MLSKDTLRVIEERIKQIIDPLGFDLVELKCIRAPEGLILRLLVDRQEGGITIGECAQLNNQIGEILDKDNIISERYILEVSSPGLDRYLIKPKDFRRVLNKSIHIFLKEEQDGKKEFKGRLVNLDAQGLYLIDDEGKESFIYFTKINKAKQVI